MAQGREIAEWVGFHSTDLRRKGVGEMDVWAATHLGWYLYAFHRYCFGREIVPVAFNLNPDGWFADAIASCHGGRFAGTLGYAVYPHALWTRVRQYVLEFASDWTVDQVLQSIAVHEMRHRVQDKEQTTLVMFTPQSPVHIIADPVAVSVCRKVSHYFTDQETLLRARGKSADELAWRFGPLEYDASVIERLYLNWLKRGGSVAGLPVLIRGNGPIIPSVTP